MVRHFRIRHIIYIYPFGNVTCICEERKIRARRKESVSVNVLAYHICNAVNLLKVDFKRTFNGNLRVIHKGCYESAVLGRNSRNRFFNVYRNTAFFVELSVTLVKVE